MGLEIIHTLLRLGSLRVADYAESLLAEPFILNRDNVIYYSLLLYYHYSLFLYYYQLSCYYYLHHGLLLCGKSSCGALHTRRDIIISTDLGL